MENKRNIYNILAFLLFILLAIFFSYAERSELVYWIPILGIIGLFFFNIDSFDTIKVWKVLEAKTRKVEKAIDEAHATIEQLSAVAVPILKANLSFLLYEGVFDGMPADEQESTFRELVKIKESLEISDIDEHFNQAAKGVASHYFMELYRHLGGRNDDFRVKYDKYTTIYHAPETPSVEELETFFEKHPYYLEDEVKYYYEKFKDIKKNFAYE